MIMILCKKIKNYIFILDKILIPSWVAKQIMIITKKYGN